MTHVTYGYKIEKGKAIIDPTETKQVQLLFNGYLEGLSLKAISDNTGIKKTHSVIGLMLENKRYLGDGFYPAIIDEDIWNKVQEERQKRKLALGRDKLPKPVPPPIKYEYVLGNIDEAEKYDSLIKTQTDNPLLLDLILKRAESIYMAIQSKEVIMDGK